MRPLRVIVIDDEPSTCSFLHKTLTAEGHECKIFVSPEQAEKYLSAADADMALAASSIAAENGVELLARLRVLRPRLYPVIMKPSSSAQTSTSFPAPGAFDFVNKPLTLEQVRALCLRAEDADAQYGPTSEYPAGGPEPAVIGGSPKMLAVHNAVRRVAATNVNVLITGASGTGKELVARAIHAHSKRRHKPFTPVNCGSLTQSILESELFGHEKGAFTGASNIHKGLIETTDGGTLFLDELTETTLAFQVALLRVIQEQQVRRVGSSRYFPVDVRIVAASNRDVPSLIRNREFREDLYYRVAVVHIEVPPLNQRREDIPLLVQHFLRQFNLKNDCQVGIQPAAVRMLQEMNWPGNIRELENTVSRLAIFAESMQIAKHEVQAEIQRVRCDNRHPPKDADVLPERLLDLERQHIIRILKESAGNKAETARRLGIERKTLYRKARRLGVELS